MKEPQPSSTREHKPDAPDQTQAQTQPAAAKATPLIELERLRSQGIISEQEFERKQREVTSPGKPVPPRETLSTPEGEYELATVNRRLGARVIDALVVEVVFLAPAALLVMSIGMRRGAELAWIGLLIVLALAYDAIMTSLFGRTVGKLAMGMRVVDAHTDRPGWGRSIGRALLVPITPIFHLLVYGIATKGVRADAEVQLLHDLWCGTYVVRESHGQLRKAIR